jgi:peroxiredoxin
MKRLIATSLAGAFALATSFAAEIGKDLPEITAKNTKGEEINLADHKGKVIVLEWLNFDCPFVKKHYETQNMQKLQEKATGQDVVWLTVNSSAEGKQGHMEASKLGEKTQEKGLKATHVIVDADGKVGKAFDAKVTPHMIIVNKEGKIAYSGAIDSKATTNQADVESADPLFANALEAVINGNEVVNAKNEPYGCGIKY